MPHIKLRQFDHFQHKRTNQMQQPYLAASERKRATCLAY